MDSKAIISILSVMIFSISTYAESAQYVIRKRMNPSQTRQDFTNQPTKRIINTSKARTTTNQNTLTKSTNNPTLRSTKSTNTPKTKTPTNVTKSRINPNSPSTKTTNPKANRINTNRNLSSAMKNSSKTITKSVAKTGLSTTTITLSSIGGVALASGVGGGIYALVKKKKKDDSTSNEPIRYTNSFAVSIGMVDSGFDSTQIPSPSKNFYNVGVTPGDSDTGHGTNVAKAIRKHNTDSNLYMYSARCGNNGICPTPAMFDAMYERNVKVINGSWGRIEDKDATSISAYHFEYYYTSPLYYGMAKEAATRRIFVFAAGNDNSRHANMQGSLPLVATKIQNYYIDKVWENARRGWITVTATNWKDNILDIRYANWIGEEAQNFGIAVVPYEFRTGTSYSAPVVTAVVANVWNHFPWMSNHLVTQTILSTADKYTIDTNSTTYNDNTNDKWHPNVVTDGPNKKTGWGILNENRALKGPARFDKRLLVPDDKNQVQVNFSLQHYDDLNRLTFSNDIAGDAGLHKYGNGVLYMSGSNTYTGNTDIDDGSLILSNALLHSNITINTNGTLRTQNLSFLPQDLTQPTWVTLGTLNTNYTLTNYGNFEVFKNTTLNGNYISGNNATLSLDVDAKLNVMGNVDMSGGQFAIHSLSAIPSANFQTKTLLTAQNGINQWNGVWSVAQDSSAFLRVSEVKLTTAQNNNLSVTYKRDSTRGVISRAMGYTPQNLQNIGIGLDNVLNNLAESNAKSGETMDESTAKNAESSGNTANFSTDSSIYAEALSLISLSLQNAPSAISSLSGEIYDSNINVMHKSSVLLNRTIARRLYQINETTSSGVWADISYAKSTLRAEGFSEGKIAQYALMAGLDGIYTNKDGSFGGGILFSVDKASGDFGVVGKSDMLSYGVSLYALASYKNFYMLTRLGANLHDTSVTRKLNFGNGASLQNKQKDSSYHGYIEAGFNMDMGFFRITPFMAWEEDLITRSKVRESGKDDKDSNFALTLDATKYRVSSLIYGVKGFLKFNQFSLEYSALNMFAPKPNSFSSKVNFVGANDIIFTSSGIPQSRNLVFVSIGASYAFSNLILRGEYSLSLNPTTSRKIEDEIINLNLRYIF